MNVNTQWVKGVIEIENPYELEIELNTIPGVLENGIFAGITDKVIVGKETGNEVIAAEKNSPYNCLPAG